MNKNTIVTILTVAFFGAGALFFSLGIQKYQVLTSSQAEFEGTGCNDDNNGTLNTSGSTSWTINCSGTLQRKFTYALFWCPNKKQGATFCIPEDGAEKIDSATGDFLPSSLSKSTDKICGCVQWDIGVFSTTDQEGVAGGAMICAPNECSTPPTDTPQPTTPPQETQPPTNTPGPTHTAVPPTATHTAVPPTATHTAVPPTATHTAVPPTATATAVPPTATHTAVPPTATAVPPTPTPTQIVVVVTNSPTPVVIVETFPSPTPVTQLAVDTQKPGITPWVILLIPFVIVLLGLAL